MSDFDVLCGDCAWPMELRENRFGKYWQCVRWPECTGTHGAHQSTGKPLGTPANRETREARVLAHRAFDTMWAGTARGMAMRTRTEAYQWLADRLQIPFAECHIGAFDLKTCQRVTEVCLNLQMGGAAELAHGERRQKKKRKKWGTSGDDPLPIVNLGGGAGRLEAGGGHCSEKGLAKPPAGDYGNITLPRL